MKRLALFALVCCVVFGMVGCDAVQRKFTRKKKAAPKKPRIYQVQKYEKKPTPELYNKHFVYWQTWSGELIEVLGQNKKKDVRCIDEMVGNLKDMQNILVKEKGDELQPHIDTAVDIKNTISRGDMSFSVRNSVHSTLEREDRAIKREFITSKVKNQLKRSFDEDIVEQGSAPEMEDSKIGISQAAESNATITPSDGQ
ncbi:MAG: hypothetical protein KBB52_07845 [Candidatus Omnitrophica bacterium]|nr:hypothetical protein [Candidatus Omnitrophota bacterium]